MLKCSWKSRTFDLILLEGSAVDLSRILPNSYRILKHIEAILMTYGRYNEL